MGSIIVSDVTGEGFFDLADGGWVMVWDVICFVSDITSPRVRQLGTAHPIQLSFAGKWALGWSETVDAEGGGVNFAHVIMWEKEDVNPLPNPLAAECLHYRLAAGVTARFEVYW